MPAGGPGDHPLTDLLNYGQHPFPKEIEELVLAIVAITPEALHETKLREADWFAWARGEKIDTAKLLLSSRLQELQKQIGGSNY